MKVFKFGNDYAAHFRQDQSEKEIKKVEQVKQVNNDPNPIQELAGQENVGTQAGEGTEKEAESVGESTESKSQATAKEKKKGKATKKAEGAQAKTEENL